MPSFDYFVGRLQCPKCSYITGETDESNMQTKIQEECNLSHLKVGSQLNMTPSKITGWGYFEVEKPIDPSEISLIETWDCPNCGNSPNWAKICISDRKIISIETIVLSKSEISRSNYLSEAVENQVGSLDWNKTKEEIIANILSKIEEP